MYHALGNVWFDQGSRKSLGRALDYYSRAYLLWNSHEDDLTGLGTRAVLSHLLPLCSVVSA